MAAARQRERRRVALPFQCPRCGRELKILADNGQVRGLCILGHQFIQRTCDKCGRNFSYEAGRAGRAPTHCLEHRRST